jgi:hypothetical protein
MKPTLAVFGADPSTRTEPEVGLTNPFSNRANVDFPDPFAPIIAVDFDLSSSEMLERAL